MARRPPNEPRVAEPAELPVPRAGDRLSHSLHIEIDERNGWLRIDDPRAFQKARRGFCRRLLEAASTAPGFEKAEIDLAAASCRIEFDPRSATAGSMSAAVTAAIRHASSVAAAADRPRWWRNPSAWVVLTVFRTPEGPSAWETLDVRPGRVRLRHESLSVERGPIDGLDRSLAALDGIVGHRRSPWAGTLTLDFRKDRPAAPRLVDAVERALRVNRPLTTSFINSSAAAATEDVQVATGLQRIKYLALAGGCFTMTIIGLVVPGIPTVPFLLATSYYLARSSPRWNARLRRAPLFGSILVEWERYHGLGHSSKAKLIGLTVAIVAVTVAVGAGSPVVVVMVLVIAGASAYGIAHIPGLPREIEAAMPSHRRVRLALPPA